MIKKINVNKSDEATLIVEKIIEADSDVVILIIPRFSQFGESLNNFHLLKREADAINKKLLIESVDNRVIELAELAGMEALNPFFVKNKRQFSDIIPKKGKGESVPPRIAGRRFPDEIGIKKSKSIGDWDKQEESAKELYGDLNFSASAGSGKESKIKQKKSYDEERKRVLRNETGRESEESEEKESFLKKFPIKTITGALILGLIVYGAVVILPRADLKIVSKKLEWSYNDSAVTQLSAKADYKTVTIPNQKSTSTKNMEMKFPATGKKQVSNKASGKIIIYNGYSSDPQPLVKNTRFLSPEGKIFLLSKNIIVPGAKISEGKILPLSIDADVVAEKAGEEYNIGPVKLFQIPGFKGTPKYLAFYGESKENMTGGFVGEISYPTASDIAAANKKIKETLESSLKTELYSQISSEFKILDGSSNFAVLKQDDKESVDKDGNFSVFTEAQLTIISFKETDLISILSQKAETEKGENYGVKSYDLQYGIARMDTTSGRLSFPVNFKAVLSYKIDIEKLKNEIAGKTDIELRKAIFSLPGVDTANVSLWPFWVKKVPNDLNKINISVD